MERGDHLVTRRLGYTHHGLYLGNNRVIHYSGLANGLSSGKVEVVSLSSFSNFEEVWVRDHLIRVYDSEESVQRAESRLNEDDYSIFLNNCEHFVYWCITGLQHSRQVALTAANIGAVASQATSRGSAGTIAGFFAGAASNGAAENIASSTTRYVTSAVSGNAIGSTTAGLLGAAAGTTGAGSAAVGLVAGAIGASTAPAWAPVAIGAAAGLAVYTAVTSIWDLFD